MREPDNPVLALDHTNRGKLLYLDERFEDALEESKLACVKVVPNYVDAHVLQVQSLAQVERYDEVIRACDAASRRARNPPCSTSSAAWPCAPVDDYPGAIRDYGRALEIRPDDGRLLGRPRLGVPASSTRPNWPWSTSTRRSSSMPANADAYNGRGTAHARLGDHRAAVADAREALRLGKGEPRVTYNAARIYAMAATVAASEVGEKGRLARLLLPSTRTSPYN